MRTLSAVLLLLHISLPAWSQESSSPQVPTGEGASLLSRIESELGDIEREVDNLRAANETDRANSLSARLSAFRARLEGKPVPKSDDAELHVVGFYEGAQPVGVPRGNHPPGSVAVEITATQRPIVMCLCAYEPVNWEMRLSKGVRLKRVVLSGYHSQEVTGVPKSIPVEKHVHDAIPRSDYAYAYKRDHTYVKLARALAKWTDLELATFQGSYRYEGIPVLVGPENKDWRLQQLRAEILPVHRSATRYAKSLREAAWKTTRFSAPLFSDQPHSSHIVSLRTFTPIGPLKGKAIPVPRHCSQLNVVPNTDVAYGLRQQKLVKFDTETGQATEIEFDSSLPETSGFRGAAYDSKRRRMVLLTSAGGGYLYSYSLEQKSWSILAQLGQEFHSLSYSPADDCFYSLLVEHAATVTIKLARFSAEGGQLSALEPSETLVTGEQYRPSRTHVYAVGRFVAVITPPQPDLDRPTRPDVPRCYLIDPRTAKVVYSGWMKASVRPVVPTDAQLNRAWDRLRTSEVLLGEQATWDLVAAEDRSVALIRRELRPLEEKNLDRAQALVIDLGNPRFAVRQKAFGELSQMGDIVVPILKDALDNDPPAEVRRRAQELLNRLERGEIVDPELRREQRAVRALRRLGSPEAVKLLRELAGGPSWATRTREAKDALGHLGKNGDE